MKLYFWFQGVPADREGGPWWSRTFADRSYFGGYRSKSAVAQLGELLASLRPFLHAYAETDGSEGDTIEPPPGAVVRDSAGRVMQGLTLEKIEKAQAVAAREVLVPAPDVLDGGEADCG